MKPAALRSAQLQRERERESSLRTASSSSSSPPTATAHYTRSSEPLMMRRIRANAILILTVAWILGTFYYLWQDSKPSSSSSSSSSGSQLKNHGRLEDRTLPLIVSDDDDDDEHEGLRADHCCRACFYTVYEASVCV